ncbi:MAG: beta-ketoacyl-[Thermoguttaceae bacterium]|nr:beta-ketoacyl-[acyl-carrier-protein] synthase II [Thermoguttaceae bacterium]
MGKRVVITGLGLVSPLGCEVETAWRRLREGESGVSRWENPLCDLFRSRIAGQCLDFTPSPYIEPKDVKKVE